MKLKEFLLQKVSDLNNNGVLLISDEKGIFRHCIEIRTDKLYYYDCEDEHGDSGFITDENLLKLLTISYNFHYSILKRIIQKIHENY